MTKYNQAFKQQVVEHHLAGYDGYSNTGKHFALDCSLVRKWVAVFQRQGIDGLAVQTHKTKYSAEFKQQVIVKIHREGLSLREAMAEFGVRDSGTISQWLRLYQLGGIRALWLSAHHTGTASFRTLAQS